MHYFIVIDGSTEQEPGATATTWYPHSMSLYGDDEGDDAGRLVKIDWYTRLRKLGKRPRCVPVWLCHGNKRIQGYLVPKTRVLEKMTQSRFAHAQRKLDNPRQLTDWRLWKTVADDLKAGIKACFPVDARFADDNIKSLSERPRKRTLQGLPSPLLALLNQCWEMALSRV